MHIKQITIIQRWENTLFQNVLFHTRNTLIQLNSGWGTTGKLPFGIEGVRTFSRRWRPVHDCICTFPSIPAENLLEIGFIGFRQNAYYVAIARADVSIPLYLCVQIWIVLILDIKLALIKDSISSYSHPSQFK